ncbi:MAG TPA: glycosyltransferase, partial [Pyrinomonadaceae bacterium]|nr:glycosyltransferase [Pyrinomonadaceae bacterium]
MSKTRPLRVLHIIDTLGGGGSERLVWDIVRLSDPARVQHRVVTIFPDGYLVPFVYAEALGEWGAYRGKTALKKDFSRKGAKTQREEEDSKPPFAPLRLGVRNLPRALKNPLLRIWNFAFSIGQDVKRASIHVRSMLGVPAEFLRFKPDVVHTHGFYGFKYGLLFPRPTVHIVPALFAQMEAQGTGWLVNRYRRVHRHVDCFALDAGYRNELLSIGVPANKLLLIDGTLDLDAINAVRAARDRHRSEVRRKLGLPDDAIIALSVGRLDPSKGHAYALEALPAMLKQFPNLHWIVLGEGDHRRELEKRIKELGVEKHAHLIGFDPQPLPYYAAADVFLRTTTMEGENISSRQAIAMGLPTVGFDTCCETDLIAKLGHGILVPNADADALATATCQILS